jgi:Ni2+-binding GTPase involved in maturation of urease and hydrogenase
LAVITRIDDPGFGNFISRAITMIKIHLAGGFLGSGKTTAIRNACSILMDQGIRTGVVTNDQGVQLVDGFFFDSQQIPARQVTNGCFCCNYNDLDRHIQSLIEADGSGVIFAESVGSCTDIVATVWRPLRKFRPAYGVTVSIFADACLLYRLLVDQEQVFNEDVSYIYFKQLEEAGIVIINKIDLAGDTKLVELRRVMEQRYKNKTLLFQNSLDERSIREWLKALENIGPVSMTGDLSIDYDKYGAGEAQLAWLDEEVEIYSHTNNAIREAALLMEEIYSAIRERDYPIGHLKFLLNGSTKISFTATSGSSFSFAPGKERAFSCLVLINARVQTNPESLANLVSGVCKKVQDQTGCSINVKTLSSFQPGYPKPTHRLLEKVTLE